MTPAPGDGLADPPVLATIAQPPHSEERHGGCEKHGADLPTFDVHGASLEPVRSIRIPRSAYPDGALHRVATRHEETHTPGPGAGVASSESEGYFAFAMIFVISVLS